ncbi:MAG: 4Fe-4S binding protein, partial [Deltaproteobacteria bacterium]|nr:4Fe-4S binding protein [Deltaproteobacteria bacterium]
MLKILKIRLKQFNCTIPYPFKVKLPERFRGTPLVHPDRCGDDCKLCAGACPTNAISLNPFTLDLGRCVFCENCVLACPNTAIGYSGG